MAPNSESRTGSVDVAPHVDVPRPALWQAPIFVLGITALIGVWLARPFCRDCAARGLERDLASVRQMLLRADTDVDEVLKLASRAQEASESNPGNAGEAALLLAMAYTRHAEKSDPLRGRESWQKAREMLIAAEVNGVSEDDQATLEYFKAKVGYHTGEDRASVLVKLEACVPKTDFQAEGYALLTEGYLSLPQPNLAKALEMNLLLRSVAEVTEAQLAAAKLQGGEILLRMGKPDEARKTLEKISDHGPAAVVGKARLLRARAYQEEKDWTQASRLYNALLADTRIPASDPAQIYYNLGLCYRKLEQPQEAINAYKKCLQLSRGPEGPAAALLLAEMYLQQNSLEPALEVLCLAVARVEDSVGWQNPLAESKRVVEVFEQAIQACRQATRYDLAMKLLDPYRKVASLQQALLLKAEIALQFAQAKSAPGIEHPEARQQAQELYRLSAETYAKLASTAGVPLAKQGEYLWASAQQYLAAKDETRALAQLEQVVKLEMEPEVLGKAWYHLAEVYRGSKQLELAQKAYRKCMEYDTLYAYRARYQLAMAALGTGDLDQAEADLVFNLKMLRWESDPEALSQSLFALGSLLYQRRDYRRVVRYLEDALGRFKDNPEVTRARFQLADSYRQIAAQENQSFLLGDTMSAESREHFQKEHRRWLEKAAEEFATLEKFLDTPEGKEHLTPEQRTQVPFIAAKCWFNLGQYDKALAIYEKLIERYPNKVEGLDALGGAVSCHAALGQINKVKQRLLQIKTTLPQMEDSVREPWERWLEEAQKPLSEL